MKRCLQCGFRFAGPSWRCTDCGHAPESIDGFLAFAPALDREYTGYAPTHFEALAPLESTNFWFRARSELLGWVLATKFHRPSTILEVGCGSGFVLRKIRSAFPDVRLTASDVFTAGLAFAAKRVQGCELLQMDARSIPFDEEFDIIGAFDVLEHIDDDRRALEEMHRATATGGGIVITVPQHMCLWSREDEFAHHVRRYEAEDLLAKVRDAGFQITFTTSFVSILFPVMFLSRRRRVDASRTFDPLDELQLSRIANRLLESIMAVERFLIRWGVRLPFGGSLLVVAHKTTGRCSASEQGCRA